jgi:excinuclease ABC subunit A
VAQGTPEAAAQEPRSYTGHYLKPLLDGHAPEVVEAPRGRKKRGPAAAGREREAAESGGAGGVQTLHGKTLTFMHYSQD